MPPIDITADDEFILSDWGESRTHIHRTTGTETDFTGSLDEVNTEEPGVHDCAIIAKTSTISGIQEEDKIKRNSDNRIYNIYDVDVQGNLTYLRARYYNEHYRGNL